MKKLVLFLAASLIAIVAFAKEPLRVLAIGNSFSQDAIEQNLFEIAAADSQPMIIGNMYIGGCEIEKHVRLMKSDAAVYDYRKIGLDGVKHETKNTSLSTAISDEKWDYVSVQQASGYSGRYESYETLGELVAWIKENAPQAKIIFHQTWAYSKTSNHPHYVFYDNDQEKMYHAIMDASGRAIVENGIELVVPAGTAIQIARGTSLGDDLTRDGYHLDLRIGRYIAAATWYEVLTGKTVVGNNYLPKNVSKEELKTAQQSAHKAVKASRKCRRCRK